MKEEKINIQSALNFLELKNGYTEKELFNNIEALLNKKCINHDYRNKFFESIIILERHIGIFNTDNLSYYEALNFLELKTDYTKEELFNNIKSLLNKKCINHDYRNKFFESIIILERHIGIYNMDNLSYYEALNFLELTEEYTKKDLENNIRKLAITKCINSELRQKFFESIRILEKNLEKSQKLDETHHTKLK